MDGLLLRFIFDVEPGIELGSIGIYVAENNLTPLDVPIDGSMVFCCVGGDTHQVDQFDDKDFMHYFTLVSQPSGKSALTLQSAGEDNMWNICNITENDKPKYLMTQHFRPIAYTTRDTAGVEFWGKWTIERQQDSYSRINEKEYNTWFSGFCRCVSSALRFVCPAKERLDVEDK